MGIRDLAARGLRALSNFVEDKPPKEGRPEAGRFISGSRDDYDIGLEWRRATPEKLGSLMRDADQGDTEAQFQVFEEVERDPRVARLYFRRRLAVVGTPLKFKPARENDGNAQKAADLCEELILGKDGEGGIAGWSDGLMDLSDAIGKAVSVVKPVWTVDGGRFIPTALERWPAKELRFGRVGAVYEQDEDDLRVTTSEDRVNGRRIAEFPLGTWLVHKQKVVSQPLARASLFRTVTWFWLFKHFGWRDWTIFLERLGIPARVGEYGPGVDQTEREALLAAILNMGKDHACVVPEGTNLQFLSGALTHAAPHPELIAACNEEFAVAIAGNTMAVEQGERGARSAKEAYQAEDFQQTIYDAGKLAETLRLQLCTPIVRLNLGPTYPVPTVEFQLDEGEDLFQRAQTDAILVNDIKLPLGRKYFYLKYDRPEPEKGEELVGAPEPKPLPPGAKKPPGQQPPPEEGEETEEEALSAAELRKVLRLAALGAQKKSSQDWVIRTLLSSVVSPPEQDPPTD